MMTGLAKPCVSCLLHDISLSGLSNSSIYFDCFYCKFFLTGNNLLQRLVLLYVFNIFMGKHVISYKNLSYVKISKDSRELPESLKIKEITKRSQELSN